MPESPETPHAPATPIPRPHKKYVNKAAKREVEKIKAQLNRARARADKATAEAKRAKEESKPPPKPWLEITPPVPIMRPATPGDPLVERPQSPSTDELAEAKRIADIYAEIPDSIATLPETLAGSGHASEMPHQLLDDDLKEVAQTYPNVASMLQYVRDVLDGREPACKWVRLACERHERDVDRIGNDDWPYRFNPDAAERVMRAVQKFREIKGPRAGKCLVLAPWQRFAIGSVFGWVHVNTGARRFRYMMLFVPRGNGKGLALDTRIATETGMRPIGEVRVGDRVFDRDGNLCAVSFVSPVHTGLRCFEVEFSTGERIVCDEEHLWLTQDPGGAKHESAKNIIAVADTVRRWGQFQHRVRIARPLTHPHVDLPIDPYLLGLWLGDGHSTSGRITMMKADAAECLVQFGAVMNRNKGTPNWRVPGLQAALRGAGLLGSKRIPERYLMASALQRLALLQGLMDTDGHCSVQPQCEFCAMNETLARDVLHLASSLGIKATMLRERAMMHGRDVGAKFRVTWTPTSAMQPFRLRRKAARAELSAPRNHYAEHRHIVAVREVESVSTVCIQVDSPSRTYLVGDTLVPTHNTTLAAPLSLYMLSLDREGGAEVYAAAVTRQQARLVFDAASFMAQRDKEYRSRYGIDVAAKAISQLSSASTFRPLSRDATSLDGLNVHFAVLDEIAQHKTREVFDVLVTAMGKRAQPLMAGISTAGSNTAGIGAEQWRYTERVLSGETVDEMFWGIIYTIDKDDDWTDPLAHRKANPNWGVSVMPDVIGNLCTRAQSIASQQAAFKMKHLNLWTAATSPWMDMKKWREMADASLKMADFWREETVEGLDLAAKIDLAAKVNLFRREIDGVMHYYAFARGFLPEATVESGVNDQYQQWVDGGWIQTTAGEVNDLGLIEKDVREDNDAFKVLDVAYDPWQGHQLAGNLDHDFIPVIEVRPTVQNFSAPMKEIDALVREGRFHHDGNPVLDWCVSCVEVWRDLKDNIFPRKEKDNPQKKIDLAVALIMAMARWMAIDALNADGPSIMSV